MGIGSTRSDSILTEFWNFEVKYFTYIGTFTNFGSESIQIFADSVHTQITHLNYFIIYIYSQNL